MIHLDDIRIRTGLKPGDIGYITFLHGSLYNEIYGYGIDFEAYVAEGLSEFYKKYDPSTNRIWVCEHHEQIVGSLVLMNRGDAAQLRYFIVRPEYQGIGLGKRLMGLFMDFLHECGYRSAYLWTAHELLTAAGLYTRHGFRLVEEKESTAFAKPLKEQKYELVITS